MASKGRSVGPAYLFTQAEDAKFEEETKRDEQDRLERDRIKAEYAKKPRWNPRAPSEA